MHITVCVCTYQRPVWLRQLLQALGGLETGGEFTYSVAVADNDAQASGRAVVDDERALLPVEVVYGVEPSRNISLARNLTISMSCGDAIAFIDDDEFPEADWLFNHYKALKSGSVAGVLGPVRPHFDAGAPAWIRRSGLYDRPEHPTGYEMDWRECRTGNVLFDRRIIVGMDPVFRPEFGASGGDVDFFRRMMLAGHRFAWCNEAVVHEHVPPKRWNRRVLLSRALLRGRNAFRHPDARTRHVMKAIIAVPAYAVALPLLQLGGHHLFMRYLVKLCHHAGLLSGALGIDIVKHREM